MTETYGMAATVRFLRPYLKQRGFRPDPPRRRQGVLRRPVPFSDYRDVSRWSSGDLNVSISVDRSEIQVVVWRDGEEGRRLDMECPVKPGKIGGVECLRAFTRETLRCVCTKLKDWIDDSARQR